MWQQQQSGGHQDPSINQLIMEVRQCVNGGIYQMLRQNPNFERAFIDIFTMLKQQSPAFSVSMSDYPSVYGQFKVVCLCGNLPVFYKAQRYDIYTKLIFPPGFPSEYPVISVMNIDPGRFKVSDKYLSNALPDGTFEVKVQASSQWQYAMQFGPILQETQTFLGTNFPFFKNTSGQQQQVNLPKTYENKGNANEVVARQPVSNTSSRNINNNSMTTDIESKCKSDTRMLHDSLKSDVQIISEDFKAMLKKQSEIKNRQHTITQTRHELNNKKVLVQKD